MVDALQSTGFKKVRYTAQAPWQGRRRAVLRLLAACQSEHVPTNPTTQSQVSRSLDSLVEKGSLLSVNEGKVFLAVQSEEAVGDEVRTALSARLLSMP